MIFTTPDTMPRWYVIHTHPKQEDRANANLIAWGVETFIPKFRERRINEFTRRAIYLAKPLFSRYIFAHFDTEKLLNKICFTRGIHEVVSFGGEPAPIDDEIIRLLKLNVDEDGFILLGEGVKLGDKVEVDSGILKSLTGIFEREITGSNRVMILLEPVNFQCHIAVERELIRRLR